MNLNVLTEYMGAIFDEIEAILEVTQRQDEDKFYYDGPLLDDEAIRAEKEERRNRIVNWKSQTNLHPLPKYKHFQKPNWLRTRSNPKLR